MTITINAYTPVFFGGVAARVGLELVADKETKVDFVDVRVRSHQGWSVGNGKSRISHRTVQDITHQRFRSVQSLPVGTTRLELELVVPWGVPPSHDVAPAYAFVELAVRVSVPWWLDPRERFRIPVRHRAGGPVVSAPAVWRSRTGRGDEARIELGLATGQIAAGDTLVGSIAVFHMDDAKPREVTLSLVPMLRLQGRGRVRAATGTTYGFALQLPPHSAGTSVPFMFHVPAALPPSFESATHACSYQLVARTGSFFGGRVEVAAPLQLVDAIASDGTSRLALPPGLTDERVAGAFTTFAQRTGWHAIDDAHAAGITIGRREGDAELQLTYAHRGEAGTFLLARVAYPSLGLGLDVTPSSVLRHVFFKDLEVGIPAWDRAHAVQARDEAQALPVLRAVVPALRDQGVLGTVVRWTDHVLEFERLVVAVDVPDLAYAADSLAGLAAVIATASELAAPPAGCTVDVAAWRELARDLEGHLALADLSIAGTRGRAPVHLGLALDEHARPVGVSATVGDPEQAGEVARAVTLVLAHPSAEVAGSSAPGAVADVVARWPADIVELHLANGVAAASLQLPADPPCVVDAARVRGLVDGLHAVLAALAPEAGPYR